MTIVLYDQHGARRVWADGETLDDTITRLVAEVRVYSRPELVLRARVLFDEGDSWDYRGSSGSNRL